MAYVMLEASVRTHPKFLQAGPEASWLWVCGLGYCQEGLTDGFIPDGAVEYLGVKRPRTLAKKLVAARLWRVVQGGFQMHDYLDHNKSAEQIRETMRKRKDGGRHGGRPHKENGNLEGYENETLEVKQELNPILPSVLPPGPTDRVIDQNLPAQKPRRDAQAVEKLLKETEDAEAERLQADRVPAVVHGGEDDPSASAGHRRRGVEGADTGSPSAPGLRRASVGHALESHDAGRASPEVHDRPAAHDTGPGPGAASGTTSTGTDRPHAQPGRVGHRDADDGIAPEGIPGLRKLITAAGRTGSARPH